MMKLGSLLAATAVLSLVACSSSDSSEPSGQSGGITNPTDDTPPSTAPQGATKGRNGEDYPTTNLGTLEGDTIRNYSFYGFPDGDTTKELQPISLANYFDSTGEQVRMIHIQAAGTWCVYCKSEASMLKGDILEQVKSRKVVWILSLVEGPTPGNPSTTTDLKKWIANYPDGDFPRVLDSGNKNLGSFFNAAALPWNADIDAKTMKIVHTIAGAPQSGEELVAALDESLAKIK
jgi:hypothetical protein